MLTHGLHYSERMGRLYWTFGEEVLSGNKANAYFLGYGKPATIKRRTSSKAAAAAAGVGDVGAASTQQQQTADSGSMAAAGPWRISPALSGDTTLHSQKVRGGAMEIPQWFADRYLGGRSLGVGFGGYYIDVMKGMSMGPSLVAVSHPKNGVGSGTLTDPIELLGYGWGDGPQYIKSRYCRRNTEFVVDVQEFPWSMSPKGRNDTTNAFWAPGDSVEGAAAWVDNGTHHGVLFFTEMSTGYIGVKDDGVTLDRIWSNPSW